MKPLEFKIKQKSLAHQELGLKAAIFCIFLSILFGSNAVAIKISLTGLGTFTNLCLRFSMAIMVIWVWAKGKGLSFSIKKGQLRQLIIITLIFSAQFSFLYIGISRTNASRATLLINLQPFIILLMAHYFIPEEKITVRKISGMLLGFGGLLIVLFNRKIMATNIQSGDLLVLVCAFLWACDTIFIKKIIDDFEPFQLVFYPMLFSLPLFFTGALFVDSSRILNWKPEIIGALFYQGVITAAFGFIAWNNLLQRHGAVALHSFIFIMPLSGVLLGGLILNEPITVKILLALGLVVLGIIISQRP